MRGSICSGLLVVLSLHICLFFAPTQSKVVVCYFTNWSQYRPTGGTYDVSNIDPSACSHIIYAFAQLDGNRIIGYEPSDDGPSGMWQQFNDLKKRNPCLKTLLAIGGFTHGTARFQTMTSTAANRKEFISNAIDFLRYWKFDGVDIDWEYPQNAADRTNFGLLVNEARAAFEKEAASSGRERLLLAAAVPAGLAKARAGLDIPALNRGLDFFNLMAYDYHGLWDPQTGLASPLYWDDTLNVNATANFYVQQGADRCKLIIGLAFYARSFTLRTSGDTAVGSPAIGGGTPGLFTKTAGFLSFYEVCGLLNSGYTEETDPVGMVRYAYKGNQWITYEDEATLAIKLDWILANQFGGAMIWSFDHDDFTGTFCRRGAAPLLTTVKSKMLDGSCESLCTTTTTTRGTTKRTTTTATTTTTTTTTTRRPIITAAPEPTPTPSEPRLNPRCQATNGIFPDKSSCYFYTFCLYGSPFSIRCPNNTMFNPSSKKCENVNTTSYVCPS